MQTPESKPRFSLAQILAHIQWRSWLPSRGNMLFTLVVVFSLFWAQSAHALPWMQPATVATSTGTWPYQGRLATSSGTPITATVPMIFRLYNSTNAGATPLWEEQWTGPSSVLISDGLFNVMLGSLTPIPQNLVTGNTSLWLGITVNADNEMTPRVQLGSIPYAVQALTVPDGSITTAKIAGLNVTTAKIADANITTAKIATGAVTLSKLGPDVIFTPPDGSITTAKLANGAVTSAKLDPNLKLISNIFSNIGSDVTYTAPADIFSLPFTTTKISSMMVIVNIRALSANATSDEYVFNIKRDGVIITDDTHLPMATLGHRYFNYTFVDLNVPVGTHQYTIYVHMTSGSGQRTAHAPQITTFALP